MLLCWQGIKWMEENIYINSCSLLHDTERDESWVTSHNLVTRNTYGVCFPVSNHMYYFQQNKWRIFKRKHNYMKVCPNQLHQLYFNKLMTSISSFLICNKKWVYFLIAQWFKAFSHCYFFFQQKEENDNRKKMALKKKSFLRKQMSQFALVLEIHLNCLMFHCMISRELSKKFMSYFSPLGF